MPRSDSVFRKRWPFLVAVAVVLAIALATGTLFAANERQQPDSRIVAQQSVTDAADTGRASDLPSVPPAPERVPAQQIDNNEQEVDLPPIVKVPPQHPNLDSNLNRLAEAAAATAQQNAGQQPNATDGANAGPAPAGESVLVTFHVEPAQVAAVRQYLEDNDVFVRNVGEDWIEAHVPPALLGAASELPGVRRVDTVIPPQPQSLGSVVSQGVELHHADAWHRMGYRGQGVKVGVIDTGFQGFSELLGGELPGNVTARCYFEGPWEPTSQLEDCERAPCAETECVHGNAVSDTVVDVAPEVELYIANPMSWGDLRDAADWMAEQGVQVINMSLGWGPDGPGDGTSPFRGSPLRTVDAAVSNGITWVNSAGNSGKNVWYGTFSDPDGDGVHNFAPQDEGNAFYLRYVADSPRASSVTALMRWDDSWGGADCDLDLHLVRPISGPGNDILIDSDDDFQGGRTNDIPFAAVRARTEHISHQGTYYLAITMHTCPDPPAWIQLTAWTSDDLEYYSPGHQITNPAESRNPGMLAVAATHYWDTNTIASYSSRGPTIDGRTKPDITGIACGRSAVYPSYSPRSVPDVTCWFAGTSQSSPHLAGLAALVKQRLPDATPTQVARFMTQNAQERGPAGPDNTWGHGFAILPDPSLEVETPLSPPITNLSVQAGPGSDEATLSWDAVPDATYYRIGYVNMEVDYHLAKASCTGEWTGAFVYIDVNARNIPVANGRAQYTVRRLVPGARHAFTVLTSNNFYNTREGAGGDYSWPQNPRWQFLPGRNALPPGVTIPAPDCRQ